MKDIPQWVIRNLTRFGNCYIKYKDDYDLSQLESKYGFNYSLQPVEDLFGVVIVVKRK